MMNIAYATDETYMQHTCVSIASLLENNETCNQINIYLIAHEVSDESKEKIITFTNNYPNANLIYISSIQIINIIKNRNCKLLKWRNSFVAYFILFLSEILPNVDKILWLDSDTLVNDSLIELYETDISDYIIAAAMDFISHIENDDLFDKKHELYFNSGVVLFNLRKYRENKLVDQALEIIKRYPDKLKMADQAILNRIIRETSVYELSFIYNYWQTAPKYGYFRRLKERGKYTNNYSKFKKEHIFIYHSLGGDLKNWYINAPNNANEIYRLYLTLTPWADCKCKWGRINLAERITGVISSYCPRLITASYFQFLILTYKIRHPLKSKKQEIPTEL